MTKINFCLFTGRILFTDMEGLRIGLMIKEITVVHSGNRSFRKKHLLIEFKEAISVWKSQNNSAQMKILES